MLPPKDVCLIVRMDIIKMIQPHIIFVLITALMGLAQLIIDLEIILQIAALMYAQNLMRRLDMLMEMLVFIHALKTIMHKLMMIEGALILARQILGQIKYPEFVLLIP